jgi:hypothetical protein
MMRRMVWLGTGAALGAGGTLWVRRRVGKVADRLRPSSIAVSATAGVDRRRREVVGRVRGAVESGRLEARRREDELWSDLRTSGVPR